MRRPGVVDRFWSYRVATELFRRSRTGPPTICVAIFCLATPIPARASPSPDSPALGENLITVAPAMDIAPSFQLISDEAGPQPSPDDVVETPAYGPPSSDRALTVMDDPRYGSFGARVGTVKWETAGIFVLLTATNIGKVIKDPQSFRFQSEGFFGKDTADLGVDKLAHAYNSYLFSEILYRRMARKTGGGPKSAVTAAILGAGLQAYGEIYDGLHKGSGFSLEDVAFNLAGAGFSGLRNAVPGVREKLDFRIMIVPNHDIYTYQGKEHFEQQHFLLALKFAGFARLQRSPLRFLELHVGYHAKDFTILDRLNGVEPKRLPFIGLGVNFTELFLKSRRSGIARAARTGLEYVQIPYTALHVDLPSGKLSP